MKRSDAVSKKEFLKYTTEEIRENFLFNLFEPGNLKSTYSYYDRTIFIGAVPLKNSLSLNELAGEIHANYFLENREIGILNLGSKGVVEVDGKKYELENKEALYVGKSSKNIIFTSMNIKEPAMFYMMSAGAHMTYPTKKITIKDGKVLNLGESALSNKRQIIQLIHPDVLDTCQISMGVTSLEEGSVWNTFPPHTHDRRMETYLYFDLDKQNHVYHFMGEPTATKHVLLRNMDIIINPPWSVHYGCGTKKYSFVWAMAGENKIFTDMDQIDVSILK